MPKIKLIYRPEEAKQIFKRYVAYEKEKQFRKIPVKLIYAVIMVIICIGFLSKMHVLMYTGFASAVFVSAFLLFYQIKFSRYLQLICAEIDKNTAIHNLPYTFSFDDREMTRIFPAFSDQINWEMIKSYEINGGDIYLYLERKRLYDIVCKSVIGEEHFALFLEILQKEFH